MWQYAVSLGGAVVLNASANLLLKFAAKDLTGRVSVATDGWRAAARAAAGSPQLILGLVFFALNVPLYFFALRAFKVSLAYPIMVGGGFAVIVTVASLSHLQERLSVVQWLGVLLILAGVAVVSGSMASADRPDRACPAATDEAPSE